MQALGRRRRQLCGLLRPGGSDPSFDQASKHLCCCDSLSVLMKHDIGGGDASLSDGSSVNGESSVELHDVLLCDAVPLEPFTAAHEVAHLGLGASEDKGDFVGP